MKEKPQIIVRGYKEDIDDFIKMLKEHNLTFYPTLKKSTTERDLDEQWHNRDIYGLRPDLEIVLGAIIVELTKEGIKAIINWLRERRKKGMKNPRLKVEVEGNVVNLNARQMGILASMLEKILESNESARKTNST